MEVLAYNKIFKKLEVGEVIPQGVNSWRMSTELDVDFDPWLARGFDGRTEITVPDDGFSWWIKDEEATNAWLESTDVRQAFDGDDEHWYRPCRPNNGAQVFVHSDGRVAWAKNQYAFKNDENPSWSWVEQQKSNVAKTFWEIAEDMPHQPIDVEEATLILQPAIEALAISIAEQKRTYEEADEESASE